MFESSITGTRFSRRSGGPLRARRSLAWAIAGPVRHARRVSRIAAWIACGLGLPAEQVRAVSRAALAHDLGRIAGRSHAVSSLLTRLPGLGPTLRMAVAARAGLDGRAPGGVRLAADVAIGARVVAVASEYYALAGRGTLRNLTPEAACAELVRGAGTRFDPRVVRVWLRALDASPAGRVS